MNHAISAQIAFQSRDHSAAAEHAQRALVVDPEFWIGHVQLGQIYDQQGKPDLALQALTRASRFPAGNTMTQSFRGYLLARMGRAQEARDVLQTLEAIARERYVPPSRLALVHAGLREPDKVFKWLDEAYAVRDVGLIFLAVDPKWDPYRTDPRFDDLLRRCGFALAAPTKPATQ